MTIEVFLRDVQGFVGKIQQADIEDLVCQVRGATGVTEVTPVLDDCGGVSFEDSNGDAVTVDAGDIVGARWLAAGAVSVGTIPGTY